MKEENLPLGSNKNGGFGKLKSLVRNLKQDSEIYKAYNTLMQEQVQKKILGFQIMKFPIAKSSIFLVNP